MAQSSNKEAWTALKGLTLVEYVQVVNRDKLQRAGEDNLFVRLLYAKDKAQAPKNQDEQEKLGMRPQLAYTLCLGSSVQLICLVKCVAP